MYFPLLPDSLDVYHWNNYTPIRESPQEFLVNFRRIMGYLNMFLITILIICYLYSLCLIPYVLFLYTICIEHFCSSFYRQSALKYPFSVSLNTPHRQILYFLQHWLFPAKSQVLQVSAQQQLPYYS